MSNPTLHTSKAAPGVDAKPGPVTGCSTHSGTYPSTVPPTTHGLNAIRHAESGTRTTYYQGTAQRTKKRLNDTQKYRPNASLDIELNGVGAQFRDNPENGSCYPHDRESFNRDIEGELPLAASSSETELVGGETWIDHDNTKSTDRG